MTRTGERYTFSPFMTMRLSPPIPAVVISAAMTRVLYPPMRAPSGSRRGLPSLTIPMSVVVPPMSTTMALSLPESFLAPLILDAGPERIVSTGLIFAISSLMTEPSPLTIIRGASMPNSSRTLLTDWMSSSMTGMSLAFITQVIVRSLNPSPEDSSYPQTTGTWRISFARAAISCSCSGFLTLMNPVTAIQSTLPLIDLRNSFAASTSRGSSTLPVAVWDPFIIIE